MQKLVHTILGGLKAMPENLKWDGSISAGTVLHIGSVVVMIALAWGQFDKRASLLEKSMSDLAEQQVVLSSQIAQSNDRAERIERYLISGDQLVADFDRQSAVAGKYIVLFAVT